MTPAQEHISRIKELTGETITLVNVERDTGKYIETLTFSNGQWLVRGYLWDGLR